MLPQSSSNSSPPKGLKPFLSLVKSNPGLSTSLLLNAGLIVVVLLLVFQNRELKSRFAPPGIQRGHTDLSVGRS